VDPGGHTYPAAHGPSQNWELVPAEAPYRPAVQLVHESAAGGLYRPGAHDNCTEEPAGQKYPATQLPEHAGEVIADALPKVPAGHGEHASAPARLYCPLGHCAVQAVVDPGVTPYRPAAHSVHDPEPIVLYWPGRHIAAVALVEPAGQAYPAGHTPLHAGLVSVVLAPHRPPPHRMHSPARKVPGGQDVGRAPS
jgi:hypothetical protein